MDQGKLDVVKQEMQDWTQTFRNQWTKRDLNLIEMAIISTTVDKKPLEEMESPSELEKE